MAGVDIFEPAQGPEIELLVVIRGGLVTHSPPQRVGVILQIRVERVPAELDRLRRVCCAVRHDSLLARRVPARPWPRTSHNIYIYGRTGAGPHAERGRHRAADHSRSAGLRRALVRGGRGARRRTRPTDLPRSRRTGHAGGSSVDRLRCSNQEIALRSGHPMTPTGSSRASPSTQWAPSWCPSTPGTRERKPDTCCGPPAPGFSSPSPISSDRTCCPCWRTCPASTVSTRRSSCEGRDDRGPSPSPTSFFVAVPSRKLRVAARSAAITSRDSSDIIFTSGTTGKPKGAVLGHGASVRTYLAWSELVGLRRGDRYLVVYPFFHTAGLKSGILACVLRGATIVPHAVFDVRAGDATGDGRAHHDAPWATDGLSVDPQPP